MQVVKDCLINLEELSGLSPNPGKSSLFTCGVDNNTKDSLLGVLGFKEGSLPVRYLGVPLISSKLRKADCNALVERITAKIKSWTCKFLSYAGRAQLVRSVLFAIQVYRSSLFILPKGVTKKIEQVMRSFLWKGDDLSKGGAKVAWDSLCPPYKEGGLGFRDVEAWNRAAMVKHIWHLCTDSDHSIWSSWVRNYLIKNRNFWTLRAPGECSWTWRKLLKLRLLVHDEFSLSGSRVTRKRTPKGLFSTKSAWDLFRHKEPPVPWHRAVWFPGTVPRHAFFLWLAVLGRLPTKDVLSKHGHYVGTTCVLCGQEEESLDHLFFSCPFSSSIWLITI